MTTLLSKQRPIFVLGLVLIIGTLLTAGVTAAPPNMVVTISEIRTNQPSDDDDEYFELAGPAGTSLTGLTYIVIGDGAGGSGVVETVIPLTGQTIPADGYFLAAHSTMSLGSVDFTDDSWLFENSDNVTHMLVSGFTGALDDDLDTNDDGTFETTPWTAIDDCIALVEPVNETGLVYCATQVGPDGGFVPGHAYLDATDGWQVGGFTAGTDDTAGEANDGGGGGGGTVICGDPATMIHTIQGNSADSPLLGTVGVEIEGVVVGDYQGSDGLNGFYLQEEDADADADPLTSEGVFVYDPATTIDVAMGDVVRVQGDVDEFFTLTQVDNVTAVAVCSTGATVASAAVTLPVADLADLERFEGMSVTFAQPLYATGHFNIGRFGEVQLSANAIQMNPTQVTTPGANANALQAANDLARITLDDGSGSQNPAIVPHLGSNDTLRGGDTVTGLTGVLDYRFGFYKVQPIAPVVFERDNPRTAMPNAVGGTLTVASFNVLNYFTTIDEDGALCGPNLDLGCRGADSAAEFTLQRTKIISALVAIDADIVGLIEIENNDTAAVADLVSGLNDEMGAGTYDYVDTGSIGTDAIKVAYIYKTSTVSAVGPFAVLDSSVDPNFLDQKNRPALAQTFEELSTGEKFTVTVNHLKSKGSACDDVGDPNMNDGQGNCNGTRLAAAQAILDWLATDPTNSGDADHLILGDLNAYGMEDPIQAIIAAGYADLQADYEGANRYGYVFDGQYGTLDYAMSSASLTPQVTGATAWHINADEPRSLDYNTEFNPAYLQNGSSYRSSDHDPVVIGLSLVGPLAVEVSSLQTESVANISLLILVLTLVAAIVTWQVVLSAKARQEAQS